MCLGQIHVEWSKGDVQGELEPSLVAGVVCYPTNAKRKGEAHAVDLLCGSKLGALDNAQQIYN
jgi:hypothetical protein